MGQEQSYSRRQAEKILKDALKREAEIDSSQLVRLAEEAGIGRENLKHSVQAYTEREKSGSRAWKRFGKAALVTASETERIAFAPSFDLFSVPSSSIIISSIFSGSSTSCPTIF